MRSSEFRAVYDRGLRFSCPYFTAFCLSQPERQEPARAGFTVPRALGKSVQRNRIRRRMREAVRLRLSEFGPGWAVVFNPRRAALEAPFEKLLEELDRLVRKCQAS
ncbi:MAG: ribonuclease P protein component [Acidobacteria bacterium]|nr:ribonuclease P protein component [Acidobacteriota bacterium]